MPTSATPFLRVAEFRARVAFPSLGKTCWATFEYLVSKVLDDEVFQVVRYVVDERAPFGGNASTLYDRRYFSRPKLYALLVEETPDHAPKVLSILNRSLEAPIANEL